MDAFAMHRAAVRVWVDRLGGVQQGQWSLPTPCTEWDVRALVRHVTYEQLWVPPLVAGATLGEVGDRFEGDVLGTDPLRAAREAAEAAAAATPDGGDQERPVHLSYGDEPAAEYARQLGADYLIHSWDLAAAVGGDRGLPADLVESVGTWFDGWQERYRRGGAVAEEVPLGPEATAADRLLARFGRDPVWVPPAG